MIRLSRLPAACPGAPNRVTSGSWDAGARKMFQLRFGRSIVIVGGVVVAEVMFMLLVGFGCGGVRLWLATLAPLLALRLHFDGHTDSQGLLLGVRKLERAVRVLELIDLREGRAHKSLVQTAGALGHAGENAAIRHTSPLAGCALVLAGEAPVVNLDRTAVDNGFAGRVGVFDLLPSPRLVVLLAVDASDLFLVDHDDSGSPNLLLGCPDKVH